MDRRHFRARVRRFMRRELQDQIEQGEVGGFGRRSFKQVVKERARDAIRTGHHENGDTVSWIAAKKVRPADPYAAERRARSIERRPPPGGTSA